MSEEVRERLIGGEWLAPRLIQDEYSVSSSFLASNISRMKNDGYEFESEKREVNGKPIVFWHLCAVTPTHSTRLRAAASNGSGPEPGNMADLMIREDPASESNGVSAPEAPVIEPLFPLPRLGSKLRLAALALKDGRVRGALRSPEGAWMATFDVSEEQAEAELPVFASWLQVISMALDGDAIRMELTQTVWTWVVTVDAVVSD